MTVYGIRKKTGERPSLFGILQKISKKRLTKTCFFRIIAHVERFDTAKQN